MSIHPPGAAPFAMSWGLSTDIPVPGDYDEDGKTDIAVYHAGTGAWYVYPSGGSAPYGFGWGGDATDKPASGDYDGHGKTDPAIFRDGLWFIYPSGGTQPYGVGWGIANDKPVPGDYDRDGKADIAVYRRTGGVWFIIPSTGAAPYGIGWGRDLSDLPVTANPGSNM